MRFPAQLFFTAAFALCAASVATAGILREAGLTPARWEQLLDALDLERPEFAAVAEARAAGDPEATARALLEFFQDRGTPAGVPVRIHPPPGFMERAADVIEDVFTLQDKRAQQPRRDDGGLDWISRGPREDKEWAWFLNRHGFVPDLLAAHAASGDPRYTGAVSDLLIDWVHANPYPSRISFSAPWRPLEAARRIMHAWIPAFDYLRRDPGEHGPVLLAILASVPNHGEKLDRFASFWGGNHLITEKVALASLAAAWPEFRQAEAWFDRALATLEREIQAQTYSDGSYKELTNHYQRVILTAVQPIMPLLKDRDAEAATWLAKRVESMWGYFIMVSRPDGTGPMNNAADLEFNHFHAVEAEVAAFFGRADWDYVLSGGTRGNPPDGTPSRFFPWAGHAVLRSGWEPAATWLFFDAGPHGAAHQHEDRLNVTYFAHGRDLLADSGRYTYQPGPWKAYFGGPHAHNVLLLDGQPTVPPPRVVPRPMPVATDFSGDLAFAAAAARFSGNLLTGRGPARHTRAVILLSSEHALIIDEVIAFGPRIVEAVWNFHPGVSTEEAGHVLSLAHAAEGAAKAVVDAVGQSDPVAGWYSSAYNLREPALQRTFAFGIERPAYWVWLLSPPDAEHPVVEAGSVRDRGLPLAVTLPDGTRHAFLVQFTEDNARLLPEPAEVPGGP